MRQVFFWILWLGSAAAVVIQGGRVPYQFFYIFCILFAGSIIYIAGLYLLLRVDFKAEDSYAVSGEKTVFIARLNSAFILPVPAVVLNFSRCPDSTLPARTAIGLSPFKTRLLRGKVEFAYRGVYKVGITSWRSWDYAGIFGVGRKVNRFTEIKVLPRIVSMDDHPPLPPHETEDSTQSPSGTELFGARPYVNTDSMRSIHWKLSAKNDDMLFVKEFNATKRPPTWVVTDLSAIEGKPRWEDKLLETSLSLTRHLLYAVPVHTAAYGGTVETKLLRTEQDFNEYYHLIGLAEFDGEGFNPAKLELGEAGIMWIVTPRADITAQLGVLLEQGWELRWLLVSEGEQPESISQADAMGVRAAHIPLDGDVSSAAWML